jgi:undecaprenyl-diphosphatase
MQKFMIFIAMLVGFGSAQVWFSWESSVYRAVHDDWKSPALDRVSDGLTMLSDLKTCGMVPLALYTIGGEKESQAAKLATVSMAISGAAVLGLKAIVNRRRPTGDSPRWDSSFPSGHTALAFSTSVIYGNSYHKLWIPLLLYSTLVGFSRIYEGEHYPADVLAGTALGVSVGLLVVKFKTKILKFP